MKNERLFSVSILVLSLTIFFTIIWLPYNLKSSSMGSAAGQSAGIDKALLNEAEAAQYMNLSADNFRSLIKDLESERSSISSSPSYSYDTYKFLPYIEINGSKYFNKAQIDKWIEYNTMRFSKF